MKNIIYTRYPIVVASAFGFLQCRRSKALFCIQAFHHRGSPRHVVARSVASSTTLQEAAGGNNSNDDDDDDDDDSMMIVNTIKSNNNNNNNNSQHNQKVDWDDRIGLQAKWTNEEKGWKVAVEWRQTPFGAGLFAAQDILAETALRVGKNGRNLLQFRSVDDIEAFCRGGDDDDNDGIKELSSSSSLYRSRLLYAKDYLWGFNPNNADQQGYDNIIITDDESKLAEMEATRFFGMWVPGNGLNHNPDPNTVYRPDPQGGTDVGINLVALRDIRNGEELFDDYRRHGKAPKWLLEFAEEYKVTLNFAECNDFVVAKGKNDKKK